MKRAILIVSICTLACTGLVAGVLFSSDSFSSLTDATSVFLVLALVSGVLALTAGVQSIVHARRLQRPNWSAVLVIVTLLGVVGSCAGGLDYLWHILGSQSAANAFPEGQLDQLIVLIVAFLAVPALAALLSLFLLRPGAPRPI